MFAFQLLTWKREKTGEEQTKKKKKAAIWIVQNESLWSKLFLWTCLEHFDSLE